MFVHDDVEDEIKLKQMTYNYTLLQSSFKVVRLRGVFRQGIFGESIVLPRGYARRVILQCSRHRLRSMQKWKD